MIIRTRITARHENHDTAVERVIQRAAREFPDATFIKNTIATSQRFFAPRLTPMWVAVANLEREMS